MCLKNSSSYSAHKEQQKLQVAGKIPHIVIPYLWLGNCVAKYVSLILQSLCSPRMAQTHSNMTDNEVLVSAAYRVSVNNRKEREEKDLIMYKL